jgi:hypothetical protein
MTPPEWKILIKMDVLAKPEGLWTKICDYIEGSMKLKVEAHGTWDYSIGKNCSPDGKRAEGLLVESLVPSAPVGALIGKIGGGTAEKPDPAKSFVFVVGSYCVVNIDTNTKGALFLTMNDLVKRFDEHGGKVTVEVYEAR